MTWPTPKFSRAEVTRAGREILKEFSSPDFTIDAYVHAYEVVTNWRSCHGYPINTFQSTLRSRLKEIDNTAIVAQRLKRMPSIINKLQRFPKMELARMQDIGGLRAVVSSLRRLGQVEKLYRDQSRLAHELVNSKNYIDSPKDSGYRSIHLIYRYHNHLSPEYDGLLLELQLRTKLQHAWATAVETMGTFLDHSLKSSEGPNNWLDFFKLTGAAFARVERTAPVPGFENMEAIDTYKAVDKAARALGVKHRLEAFTIAADKISQDKKSGSYHLVILNLENKSVSIKTYAQTKLQEANKEYAEIEKSISEGKQLQVVLVSAGPIEQLRRAYPNYFLDTREFIRQLDRLSIIAAGG